MLSTIIAGVVGVVTGAGMAYLWTKSAAKNSFAHIELEVKAKAKAIENETELLLKSAEVIIKENEIEQEHDFQKRVAIVDERNRELILQTKSLAKQEDDLKRLEEDVLLKEAHIDILEAKNKKR